MQTHVEFVPEIEFRFYPGNIPTNPNPNPNSQYSLAKIYGVPSNASIA